MSRSSSIIGLHLAVACSLCATSFAQSWEKQYPVTAHALKDVATDGHGLVVAVGEEGIVMRSFDGGLSWTTTNVEPGVASATLEEVDFCGDFLIAGGEGLFLSADDGATWANVSTVGEVVDIDTFGTTHAWAVTLDGTVLRSTTAGSTWSTSTIPPGWWSWSYCIDFLDEDRGWIGGQNGLILETGDGGATWTQRASPTNWTIHKIQRDTNRSFLMERSGVWSGSAAGTGWVDSFFPWTTAAEDFEMDGAFGLATGYFGRIQRTVDGAQTWVLSLEDNAWEHYGLVLLGGGDALVVGEAERVLRTTDGGLTWTQTHGSTGMAPSPIFVRNVYAVDSSTVFAACNEGTVLRSDDGGQSWAEQDAGAAATSLRAIHFFDDQHGYAVGKKQGFYPTLCSTHDGGLNWHERNQLGMYDYYDVVAVAPDVALAAADTSIYKTTDGGVSWTWETPLPYGDYLSIDAVGDIAYAAGTQLVKSVDAGDNWTVLRNLPYRAHGISFHDDLTGWMVGENGTIEHTTDGGATWTPQTSGVTTTLRDVDVLSADVVVVAGSDGVVLVTGSGGSSWTRLDPAPLGSATLTGCTIASSRLWVAGQSTGLWSYGTPAAQCEFENYCTAKVHSGGGTAALTLFGHPSIANQAIGLGIIGAIPNTFAVAFRSDTAAASAPLHGGTLCVGAPLTRLPVLSLDNQGFGYYTIPMDASMIGSTHWYQVIFRDAMAPDGTGIGMSDGLRVSFCP